MFNEAIESMSFLFWIVQQKVLIVFHNINFLLN